MPGLRNTEPAGLYKAKLKRLLTAPCAGSKKLAFFANDDVAVRAKAVKIISFSFFSLLTNTIEFKFSFWCFFYIRTIDHFHICIFGCINHFHFYHFIFALIVDLDVIERIFHSLSSDPSQSCTFHSQALKLYFLSGQKFQPS